MLGSLKGKPNLLYVNRYQHNIIGSSMSRSMLCDKGSEISQTATPTYVQLSFNHQVIYVYREAETHKHGTLGRLMPSLNIFLLPTPIRTTLNIFLLPTPIRTTLNISLLPTPIRTTLNISLLPTPIRITLNISLLPPPYSH